MIQIFLILCLCNHVFNVLATSYQPFIIRQPVANLLFEPIQPPSSLKVPTSDLDNPNQITQLLLGEHVLVHTAHTDDKGTTWLKVSALQQQHFYINIDWHGCTGWILADDAVPVPQYDISDIVVNKTITQAISLDQQSHLNLSIGTQLKSIAQTPNTYTVQLPNQTFATISIHDIYPIKETVQESVPQLRKSIVQTAKTFLGFPYSWGGRSAYQSDSNICSVDCSALINLTFLAHGLQIPRMSHEQFLKATPIQYGKNLKPGDLIFFCSTTKYLNRMNHVMMYIDNDEILEATFADQHCVRTIRFKDRMTKSKHNLQSGDIINDEHDEYQIFFGTFLAQHDDIQKLRNNARAHTYGEQFILNCKQASSSRAIKYFHTK